MGDRYKKGTTKKEVHRRIRHLQTLLDEITHLAISVESTLPRRLNMLADEAIVLMDEMRRELEGSGLTERPARRFQDVIDPLRASETNAKSRNSSPYISVAVYLDTDDPKAQNQILKNVDRLVDELGYEGPLETDIERGSIFRRSWASLRRSLASPVARERFEKIERALEVVAIDRQQSEVDARAADTISKLVESLADVPGACIRAGSLLLVKHQTSQGSLIQTRSLTPREVQILEQYPEIQKQPDKVLDTLALAMTQASLPERRHPAQ